MGGLVVFKLDHDEVDFEIYLYDKVPTTLEDLVFDFWSSPSRGRPEKPD